VEVASGGLSLVRFLPFDLEAEVDVETRVCSTGVEVATEGLALVVEAVDPEVDVASSASS